MTGPSADYLLARSSLLSAPGRVFEPYARRERQAVRPGGMRSSRRGCWSSTTISRVLVSWPARGGTSRRASARMISSAACGCRFRSPHATCAYSWISPPSRSRRATLPAGTTTADSPGPSGGACPKARCGRWTDVVMVGVLGQHRPQLQASEDEHPVQHLTPNGPNPPLRVGIRPGCPHRRAQHLHPLGGKDRIERGGELRIPIADHKPEPANPLTEVHGQVAGLLGHPLPTGCAITPSRWTWRVATSITNSTSSRRSNTVSTVQKSTASTLVAWARR